MTEKILSIIPARGGSKGMPRKNLISLAGKPLIAWTIEASINSKYITKTVVSSDDDEILLIAKEYDSDLIKRPYSLAHDTSSSELVIKHSIEKLKKDNQNFDYVILLQPTSPLRDTGNIDDAFDLLFRMNATALISVYEINNKILKAFKENRKGFIEGISNNEYPFMRRQDLPKIYLSNGAIYIVKESLFSKNCSLYTDRTIHYEMDEVKSIDIDSYNDLRKAQKYINNNVSML